MKLNDRFLSFLSSLFVVLSSFSLSIYFTRFAQAELFKEYNLVLPLIMALGQLVLLGSAAGSTTLVLSNKYNFYKKQDIIYNSLFIGLCVSFVVIIFNYYFSEILFDISKKEMILISLSGLGLAFRDSIINFLQITADFKKSAFFGILVMISMVLAIVVINYFNFIYFIWLLLIPLSILFLQRIQSLLVTRINTDLIKDLIIEGWYTAIPFFVINYIGFIQRKFMVSKIDVQYFNSYFLFSTLSVSIFSNLLVSLFRGDSLQLAKLYQENELEELNHITNRLYLRVFYLTVFFTVIFFFFGVYFVEVLFSKDYLRYTYLIALFLPLAAINSLSSIHLLILQSIGKLYIVILHGLVFPITFLVFIYFLDSSNRNEWMLSYFTILAYLISAVVWFLIIRNVLSKSLRLVYPFFIFLFLFSISILVLICH